MSLVKSSNTKPEMIVRKFLFAQGFRYRLHEKKLPGKPDLTLKKYKTIILINGCFWHGHETCGSYQMPKSNEVFWSDKIEKNKARDIETEIKLKKLGWDIIKVWECELRSKRRELTLNTLLNYLKNKH
ncbi:MAG: very short patch repair endonuclease [Bacteroidota bacterium]